MIGGAAIALQFAPSQRSHWVAYLVGSLFHVPLPFTSVWPFCAVPLIVGGEMAVGVEASVIGNGFSTVVTSEDVDSAIFDVEDTVEEFITPSATTWTMSPAATGTCGG